MSSVSSRHENIIAIEMTAALLAHSVIRHMGYFAFPFFGAACTCVAL
jgi:hypothetical protein